MAAIPIDEAPASRRRAGVAIGAMALLLAVAPWVGFYPVFVMKALCFALFACAFNLLIGFGGLLSFDVADGGAARRVETATRVIENATSLGGTRSLMESRHRWEGDRVPAGLLRLSVGLEDTDALWSDLEQALNQV